MAACACGPHWFGVYLDHLLPSTIPTFHSLPKWSASRWVWAGMGIRRDRAEPVLQQPLLALPDGPGGLWKNGECLCPPTPCALPQGAGSPLLCVSPPLSWFTPSPWGTCHSTHRYSRAGELFPWTLPWEMPFSLLTLSFRARRGHLLVICLYPPTRVVRRGSFPSAAGRLPFSLTSLPCFHLFSFFPPSGGLFPFLVNSVCSQAC